MTVPDFLHPRPDTPVEVRQPTAAALPLVCDSPHSGTAYPADFGHCMPLALLRRGEDTDVHRLWERWPAHGATLLAATFPRTYIDPNRSADDIDPEQLAQPWPEPLTPSVKTRQGLGLIWQCINQEGMAHPIYDRKLSVSEVRERLQRYWQPYHAALQQAIDDSIARFGGVWHLNLHSMPSDVFRRLGRTDGAQLADFVLGDRDGTTCAPGFIRLVGELLQAGGYSVAYNDPYKGVELIGRIGQPQHQRHSLQIEINRKIYMDEATRLPHAGFARLQAHLETVMQGVAAYVRSQLPLA